MYVQLTSSAPFYMTFDLISCAALKPHIWWQRNINQKSDNSTRRASYCHQYSKARLFVEHPQPITQCIPGPCSRPMKTFAMGQGTYCTYIKKGQKQPAGQSPHMLTGVFSMNTSPHMYFRQVALAGEYTAMLCEAELSANRSVFPRRLSLSTGRGNGCLPT